jgi:hypothetical protein
MAYGKGSAPKDLNAANAAVLAELVTDSLTTESTRVEILNMLSQMGKTDSFFAEMLKLNLSSGECPYCGHNNHWLIPEEELNILGWVSDEQDTRIKRNTTAKDCPRYQQACAKKKVNF